MTLRVQSDPWPFQCSYRPIEMGRRVRGSQYLRKLSIGLLKPKGLPNVLLRDGRHSRRCSSGRGEGDERDVPGGGGGCGVGGGGGGGGVVVSRATNAPAAEEGGEGRDDPLSKHW